MEHAFDAVPISSDKERVVPRTLADLFPMNISRNTRGKRKKEPSWYSPTSRTVYRSMQIFPMIIMTSS